MNLITTLLLDLSFLALTLLVVAVLVWSIVWVYRDAIKSGISGLPLAVMVVVVALAWPVSLLVWLMLRPSFTSSQS